MPDILAREMIDSILPPGALWVPETDEDLDLLLDGIAQNSQYAIDFLSQLAFVRDPQKTTLLSDLEKEYGIVIDETILEQVRRNRLSAFETDNKNDGSSDFLQEKLRASGFDVYIHINNPPVNPDLFLFESYPSYMGKSTSVMGNPNAIMGGVAGELVVNGDIYKQTPLYSRVMGGANMIMGYSDAMFGGFTIMREDPVVYHVPNDPGYWGLFFFIGGTAERNISGELTTIESASVPFSRRNELRRLILKYKPLLSWGGLVVKYYTE